MTWCSLRVIIIVLIVRVLIRDIVNVPFLSVGFVVGVYVFLDYLLPTQPVKATCFLTVIVRKEELTCLVVSAQLIVFLAKLHFSGTEEGVFDIIIKF